MLLDIPFTELTLILSSKNTSYPVPLGAAIVVRHLTTAPSRSRGKLTSRTVDFERSLLLVGGQRFFSSVLSGMQQ